jgi:protein ImuB
MAAPPKTLDLFPAAVAQSPATRIAAPGVMALEAAASPGTRLPARELWLAVYFPQLPLEAMAGRCTTGSNASPARPDQPCEQPVAIVDPEHDNRTVVACNGPAARCGVVPGLGVNAAHALAQGLEIQARDVAKESLLLERLAALGRRFTPRLSLEAPDALLLEVRGSLRLFGGLQVLVQRLRSWLEGEGMTVMLALTPTPSASLWLARAGHGQGHESPVVMTCAELPARLADLPLSCLRWPEQTFLSLRSMGVTTLGECLRLPREGFARRFHPQLLDDLDRAMGRKPDLRRTYQPRERAVESLEFEYEIAGVARLVRTLEPLFAKLGESLRQRQACIRGFELRLLHREMPVTRVVIRLVAPAADPAHFIELLARELERIALPAPVHRAQLRSDVFESIEMTDAAGPLMAEWRATDRAGILPLRSSVSRRTAELRVPRLIERLRARLGSEAVHGVSLVAEHRPESASQVSEPVTQRESSGKLRRRAPRVPVVESEDARLARPLWLLSRPRQLTVEHGWPWYEGRIELLQGPERIESGWWDGADVTRDYYIARNQTGLRLWIFRERRAERQWFLHGLFG